MSDEISFRILEDIARDLSGDVNFPTCMDAAMLVRNTLRDPLADLQQVVRAISGQPQAQGPALRESAGLGVSAGQAQDVRRGGHERRSDPV
jgi:hypothetical protein